MSTRRLTATTAAMALIAVALSALTPRWPAMVEVLLHAQHTADTAGPDVVVLCTAALLAWAVWGWGALGLLLTGASALPGALGAAARVVLPVVLPTAARRAAALALGLGLGVTGPLLGTVPSLLVPPAAAAAAGGSAERPEGVVPDWPPAAPVPARTSGLTVPDWPAAPAPGQHVVVRGDCLWDIAAARLWAHRGRPPTDAEIATATHRWWQANSAVIGADPDRLLPGQVLSPPDPP